MLTKRTSYKLQTNGLEDLFAKFIKNQYGYVPQLRVAFDTTASLPIVVNIETQLDEEFQQFWVQLQRDIHSIKGKMSHQQADFELGDKLFQLCLDQPTLEYVCHEEDVYVFVDESHSLTVDFKKGDAFAHSLTEKANGFLIEEGHFTTVRSENITLSEVLINKVENCAYALYQHNENVKIEFYISKEKGVCISQHAYCHSEAIFSEVMDVSSQLVEVVQSALNCTSDAINITDNVRLLPHAITYYPELTDVESVVLSLKKQRLSYEEIGNVLGKNRKAIDATMSRIRKKIKNQQENGSLRLFSL